MWTALLFFETSWPLPINNLIGLIAKVNVVILTNCAYLLNNSCQKSWKSCLLLILLLNFYTKKIKQLNISDFFKVRFKL